MRRMIESLSRWMASICASSRVIFKSVSIRLKYWTAAWRGMGVNSALGGEGSTGIL